MNEHEFNELSRCVFVCVYVLISCIHTLRFRSFFDGEGGVFVRRFFDGTTFCCYFNMIFGCCFVVGIISFFS